MQGLVFRSLVPNPDLSITVTEPQKIGSGVNGYTVYKVQTTTTLAERFPSRICSIRMRVDVASVDMQRGDHSVYCSCAGLAMSSR